MRILAISGSLRSTSSNTAVLRTARALAPSGVEIVLYEGLGDLPHFNPDLDGEKPPKPVLQLRCEIGLADGLLISRICARRAGKSEKRARLASRQR